MKRGQKEAEGKTENARKRVKCRPKSVMPKVLTSLSDRGRFNHNNNNNTNNITAARSAVPTYRVSE